MRLSDFKSLAVGIGFNGAVEPGRHSDLRVGGLGSEIVGGVTKTLADSVDTNESTCIQVVLTGDVAGTLGVHLLPLGVRITGEQLSRVELDLRIAVRGLVGCSEGHRSRATDIRIGRLSIGETLVIVLTFAVIHVHVVHSRRHSHSRWHSHRTRVITFVHVHASSGAIIVTTIVLEALDGLYYSGSTKNSNTYNDDYSHKSDYGAK